ncbi:MAG TPA: FlgD immunoglobulin-like domain containing protein, partial [Elusimicrobiota bacterium]|nr:FlgD immunoglobulin-like domain containing protein [Elusimicrobiota bacterium]
GKSLTISLPNLAPAPIVHSGETVTVTITSLKDLAGNALAQPFVWSWQANLAQQSGSQLSEATFNGGQDPSWSPDAQKLAFSSNRTGSYNMFVLASQNGVLAESTSTLTQLTNTTANATHPAWSPDGSQIAFAWDVTGQNQIWMMPSAGGPAVQLSTSASIDTEPAWSPDGAHVVFSRSASGFGNLWSIDLDSHTWIKRGEHQLTNDDIGYDYEPRYSADGTWITYCRSLYVDNINTIHADGSGAAALTATGADDTPSYAPDGQDILFSSARGGIVPELWTMSSSGQNQAVLLDNSNMFAENEPVMSGDGSRVAFTSTRSGAANVWILSLLKVTGYAATPSVFSPAGASVTAKKTVTVTYQLSASNVLVNLNVYDNAGRLVRTLLQNDLESAGTQTLTWNGQLADGTYLADGAYSLTLTAQGQATSTVLTYAASVIADSTPPQISLYNDSGNLALGVFNPASVLMIKPVDAGGIAETDLAIDSTVQFQVAPATFSLPAGLHVLAMRAMDIAGNMSAPVLQTANIDALPPESTLQVNGPFWPAATGVYVAADTTFTLTAVDDSSGAVVSGVASYFATLDGSRYVAYNTPQLNLPSFGAEGPHSLTFQSADQAGNFEALRSSSMFVDATPPVVEPVVTPPLFFNGVRGYAAPSTSFGFSAQDPLSQGDASGVGSVFASVDGGAFAAQSSTFTLPAAGAHAIEYYALDNVGNASVPQTLAVVIATAPPTAMIVASTPSFTNGTTNYASA